MRLLCLLALCLPSMARDLKLRLLVGCVVSCALAMYGSVVNASDGATGEHAALTQVVFETALGDIVIAVDQERAPQTAGYFLGFIQRGQYNGASLYRSASFDGLAEPQLVQGGMLQNALNTTGAIDPADYGVALLPTIESTELTGMQHTRGAVSLARDLLDTGFVIPEIVFCLRAVPSMDANGRDRPDTQGFPVFGHVVSGMDVIEAVTRRGLDGPTTIPFLAGQILTEPVVIQHAYQQTITH